MNASHDMPPIVASDAGRTEGTVKVNNAVILGLIGFFAALFLLFIFEPGIRFNKTAHVFTGYLFSMMAALCCWYFLGQIASEGFSIGKIKIKAANGSFLVLCIFASLWTTYYSVAKPDEVKISQEQRDEAGKRQLEFFRTLTLNYADLDIKVELLAVDGSPIWPDRADEDIGEYAKYLELSAGKTKDKLDWFNLTFHFPDERRSEATTKVRIFINMDAVQRTFRNFDVSSYKPWRVTTDQEAGYYIFETPVDHLKSVVLKIHE